MTCKWTDDSQWLIKGYFDAIQNSPCAIYYHTLPLCPPSSWLCEYYRSEIPQVKIVKVFQATWGVCSHTVSFGGALAALAQWEDILPVGFWQGQIIILDTATGIQMYVLSGHHSYVTDLTFSLDGTSLVSASLFFWVQIYCAEAVFAYVTHYFLWGLVGWGGWNHCN